MASFIVPYDPEFFHNPKNTSRRASRAVLGWCSWCYKPRKAEFAIITSAHVRWAACRLHAKLFNLRKARQDIYTMFDEPSLESAFSSSLHIETDPLDPEPLKVPRIGVTAMPLRLPMPEIETR